MLSVPGGIDVTNVFRRKPGTVPQIQSLWQAIVHRKIVIRQPQLVDKNQRTPAPIESVFPVPENLHRVVLRSHEFDCISKY
jgi:hypothetical protein